MSKKEMICIICPLGCRMAVETSMGAFLSVTGNNCPRGEVYADGEITCPTRILPTTVRIFNAHLNRLPVRTESVIPKSKIKECMNVLMKVSVEAPVKMGDIIIHDIMKTGVDVIASRSLSEEN